jgi:hypothetical protein
MDLLLKRGVVYWIRYYRNGQPQEASAPGGRKTPTHSNPATRNERVARAAGIFPRLVAR